ncbi:BcsR/BcsP family cellulose biosynthesis protein [Proteus hauseri]|uniref:BcsR/BcsP family cellulose biosynthesis protein n=1 Tax=Proteus hauseri TaxID=183417 RepID=UPI0032DA6A47
MENKIFISHKIKIEKNNPNQDINQLKNLFSLNNYHYKDIINDKKNLEIIYRWRLLRAFNYNTKRG